MLRHIVLFGFTPVTTTVEIAEITQRFAALEVLPEVDAFEYGPNTSPEGLNGGLTHCFVLTFASDAARDAYLIHPDHVAFADWVGQWVAEVRVVDYWITPPA